MSQYSRLDSEENNAPFGVKLKRHQVCYWAAGFDTAHIYRSVWLCLAGAHGSNTAAGEHAAQ